MNTAAGTPSNGTGVASEGTDGIDTATAAFADLLSGPPAKTPTRKPTPAPLSASDDHDDLALEGDNEDDDETGGEVDAPAQAAAEPEPDVYDDIPDDIKNLKIRFKNGDKDEALTLEEIRKGYLRTADYTQKTMEVAEHRKGLENNLNFLSQQRQQVDQVLGVAGQLLQAQMPQEPDWNALALDPDPRVLIMAQKDWQARQTKLQQFTQAQQANRTAWEIEQDQLRQSRLATEFERLTAKNADLKDPVKRTATRERISSYATQMGFTPDELKGVFDHRMLLVLDDAAKYREAVKRSADKRAGVAPSPQRPQPVAVRTATPGTPSTQTRSTTQAAKNFQRLVKTGKVSDAQAAFRDIL